MIPSQQLDMLKQMRKYHPDAQSALLEAVCEY